MPNRPDHQIRIAQALQKHRPGVDEDPHSGGRMLFILDAGVFTAGQHRYPRPERGSRLRG